MSPQPFEQTKAGHVQPLACDADLVVACRPDDTYSMAPAISPRKSLLSMLSSKAMHMAFAPATNVPCPLSAQSQVTY